MGSSNAQIGGSSSIAGIMDASGLKAGQGKGEFSREITKNGYGKGPMGSVPILSLNPGFAGAAIPSFGPVQGPLPAVIRAEIETCAEMLAHAFDFGPALGETLH